MLAVIVCPIGAAGCLAARFWLRGLDTVVHGTSVTIGAVISTSVGQLGPAAVRGGVTAPASRSSASSEKARPLMRPRRRERASTCFSLLRSSAGFT